MRDLDLAAIRQTLSAYNVAGDRLKLDDLAQAFLPDGVLETVAGRYVGRTEIVAGLGGGPRSPGGTPPPRRASFVRHHLTTSHITFAGERRAKGRSYFIVFTDIGPDRAGCYLDDLRKLDDKWLLAHRRVQLDWISDDTLMGGLEAHRRRLAERAASKD